MKKLFSILLIFIVILSFPACRPKGMKKDVYDLAKQALRLMDDYHSGKIASEDVDAPLNSIISRLESIEKRDEGKRTGSEYGMNNSQYASCIKIHISSFLFNKNFQYANGDTYDAVENIKNLLK